MIKEHLKSYTSVFTLLIILYSLFDIFSSHILKYNIIIISLFLLMILLEFMILYLKKNFFCLTSNTNFGILV